MLGCGLISFHFLWAILSTSTVEGGFLSARTFYLVSRKAPRRALPDVSASFEHSHVIIMIILQYSTVPVHYIVTLIQTA